MQSIIDKNLSKESREISEVYRRSHVVNNLEMIVMGVVKANEESHGYGVITKFRKIFGVYLGPSTIYPMLNNFEKQGLMKSKWEISNESSRPNKVYRLTPKGELVFQASKKEFIEFAKVIALTPNFRAKSREFYDHLRKLYGEPADSQNNLTFSSEIKSLQMTLF